MLFTFRVSLCSLVLGLSLIGPVLAQTQSSSSALNASPSPAESDVRAAVEKYFALYASQDLDGLMNLWSAKIPDPAGKRKAIEKQFATLDVSINSLTISRVKMEGERATLRVTLKMTITLKQNRQTAPQPQTSNFQLREEVGDPLGISRTLKNLGLLYQDQGNYGEMLEVSRRAARLAEEVNAPEELWQAQDGIGRALSALGQPVPARQSFLAAIATIEALRHQVAGGAQQQQSFLEDKLSPWLDLITLLVSQHQSAEALTFAERSKARVLLDVLEAGRPNLHKSLSPQEHQAEEERRLRLVSLNSQLTRELRRGKVEAGQARILHFATHGMLNNAAPMYSHLVLAPGSKNEDGLLEAWELMQLDLKADLAVLSACETARGRFGAGEGMIGLTWALFVAGVPSTVVSQWQVESASTRDLMLSFHRQLRTPSPAARVTKAEALRQAALSLMKHPETSHPFYWAGFVLVGDGR